MTSEDYYEDRFLRMRIEDRYRWSALDDYYFNNTYAYNSYGNYNSWNSPWNSYWHGIVITTPIMAVFHIITRAGVIIKLHELYTPPSRALVFNPNSYNTRKCSTVSQGISVTVITNRYNNKNRNSNIIGRINPKSILQQ